MLQATVVIGGKKGGRAGESPGRGRSVLKGSFCPYWNGYRSRSLEGIRFPREGWYESKRGKEVIWRILLKLR